MYLAHSFFPQLTAASRVIVCLLNSGLSSLTQQFTNAVPSLDLPDYTAHMSSLHQTVSDDTLNRRFNAFYGKPSGPGTPGSMNPGIQPLPPS